MRHRLPTPLRPFDPPPAVLVQAAKALFRELSQGAVRYLPNVGRSHLRLVSPEETTLDLTSVPDLASAPEPGDLREN